VTAQAVPRWAAVALMMAIATIFGTNHIAARIAFDHGTNVTTAVTVRSAGTALFVLLLLLFSGTSLKFERQSIGRMVAVGLLISIQSYCLYSAVAIIPVALALLAFNTHPMALSLLSWLSGGERPAPRMLVAMPVALAGLALALDLWGKAGAQLSDFAGRWAEIGAGVLWATGAALSFALAMLLTGKLGAIDGRLRSFITMTIVALVALAGGTAVDGFALPVDTTGWVALAALTALYGTAITSLFVVLPKLGAVNNMAILNFEPIAVLAIAWVALDQSVAPLQVLGAFIVIGSIMWMGAKRT
jgi:drug/metabolite transporter (DMT)-like permease